MGFVLNPYDPCVANATIKGSQCTIVWFVDDNKISHKDPAVVHDVVQRIEAKFGTMTKTEGDEHEFLGMKLLFDRQHKTVQILMQSYLDEAIHQSQLDVRRPAATPATKGLFEVDPQAAPLKPPEADRFRSVVCKLLYVALRGRPDVLLAVVFLASRVAKATLQDQAKLKRLLEYLYGTYDLALILGADDIQTMYTFVDASFAVHGDMKSHTGGVITFGRGGIACKSAKQKLVTKSSTEAELVGASEYLPSTIWVQHFLEAQGFPLRQSYLEQDNQSAMRLEQNGRGSASQRSRHINIRYFLLRIALARTTLRSGIAKRIICLPIFYPSLFKGICSVNSVMFSWAMPMCPLFVYRLRPRVRSVLSSTTGPYPGAPGNPTRDLLARVWVRPRPHIRIELDRR